MQLPEKLLQSLEGVQGFDREAFEQVHESGEQITSIRINPLKSSALLRIPPMDGYLYKTVPWSQFGYYLKERPSFTFDPLFHAGCYYVQEASGMFLEQALKQTLDLSEPLKILDISAAPGGKSTHIQSLISKDSLLVSNEVIRSRANVLRGNIIKWGGQNVVVTNNDPKSFSSLKNFFDVLVVDAPCSGSGLFRRDEHAVNEWSENNIQLCSQRQQRILADIWPALKMQGTVIYSTCSYSKEENEDILDWMMDELGAESCRLIVEKNWNIDEVRLPSGATAYRFWPYKVKGEGFFIAALRKKNELDSGKDKIEVKFKGKKRIEMATNKEKDIAGKWVRHSTDEFARVSDKMFCVEHGLISDINLLANHFYVLYFGTLIGDLVRDKLIPDHALALSNLVSDDIHRIELSYDDAIAYLKRKDLKLSSMAERGWQMVTYERYPLGWINVLANRINNYYPGELRILKDI